MISAKDTEIRSYNSCPMEHTVGEIHESKSKYITGFIGSMKEVQGLGSIIILDLNPKDA